MYSLKLDFQVHTVMLYHVNRTNDKFTTLCTIFANMFKLLLFLKKNYVCLVPSELGVIKKEQFNNWYKLRTYYTAFQLANLPIQVYR